MTRILTGLVIIFYLSVIVFNHFFFSPTMGPAIVLNELNSFQTQTLSLLLEMSRLLITLSTALLGIIGLLFIEYYKAKNEFVRISGLEASIAVGMVLISIDFGYIFMEKWVEMLLNETFRPFDRLVMYPQKMQFVTFFLSLMFAFWLAYRILIQIRK